MKGTKQKDIFLSQFLSNEAVYNRLSDYYKSEEVIIYDKEKLLINTTKNYGSSSKNIKMEVIKPRHEKYFLIYSFTLNENLASIVLATSNMDYGIIYYLKRENNNNWLIMNTIPMNSR